jgi:hypothetical protein
MVGDNVLGIICKIAFLPVGASTTCTATSTAIAGQYRNIGKAGSYYGDPKAGGILAQDIDYGYYFGKQEQKVKQVLKATKVPKAKRFKAPR